jgi:hypothetical protein
MATACATTRAEYVFLPTRDVPLRPLPFLCPFVSLIQKKHSNSHLVVDSKSHLIYILTIAEAMTPRDNAERHKGEKMANMTYANRYLMKPGTVLFIVEMRRANEKSMQYRQMFDSEQEAKGFLDAQIDSPAYPWAKDNVVAGCVRKAHTVRDTDQLESKGVIHHRNMGW